MSWCWFALCPAGRDDALASAAIETLDGEPVGVLVAWPADAGALPENTAKIDARAIDPHGPAGTASLVLPRRGGWLPFDDPAVSQAMRTALLLPPVEVLSTLVVGNDRFVGALTAVHDQRPDRLRDDPFATVFPSRLVHVAAGLLGRMPAPVGPTIQRYGADNPWPWDRF